MKFELTGRFNDFTRSAILRSFIIVYFNQRYINDAEIHREFVCLYLHEKIVCRCNRFDHLVQKQHLFFSIFHFIRDYLLTFWYFSFFVVKIWMHVTCPVQWVGFIAGVRHGWLHWISWFMHLSEPFSTPAMNFTHRSGWITCIQNITTKNERHKNFKR